MEIWRLSKRVAGLSGVWMGIRALANEGYVGVWRDKSTKREGPLRPGVSPRPQACYLFQFSLCPHQHIKLKRANFKAVAAHG